MGKYYWERYLDDPELCLSTRAFLNQFDKKPSIIKKVLKFLFRRKPKMKPKTDWSHVWIEKDLKDLAEESKKISKKLEEDLDTTRKDLLTIINMTGGIE